MEVVVVICCCSYDWARLAVLCKVDKGVVGWEDIICRSDDWARHVDIMAVALYLAAVTYSIAA